MGEYELGSIVQPEKSVLQTVINGANAFGGSLPFFVAIIVFGAWVSAGKGRVTRALPS